MERHAHAITGDDAAIGVVAVHASGTAGGHDHRIGADLHAGAFHHVHCDQTADLTVIHQNIQHKVLVETLDLRVFERGLEQGMQHVEAGLVGGEPGSFNLHAAEATHVDRTVRFTAPRAAPLFQLGHFPRAVVDEMVDHVLLTQPVATGNGVVEVVVKRVVILSDGGGSPFGGYRMAAHRVDF
ncbi:hypothetical protein D3C71_1442100 [compost metagenome]